MPRITRYERYQEALAYLRESAAAIDQAHAIIAELGLAPEIETHAIAPVRYVGIAKLSSFVDAMALSLANEECPECEAALTATCCGWGSAAPGRERKAA